MLFKFLVMKAMQKNYIVGANLITLKKGTLYIGFLLEEFQISYSP